QIVRPEDQARAAALEAGEIEIAADLVPDAVKSFAGRRGYKTFYPPYSAGLMALFNTRVDRDPNTGGPNPFRDIRVRRAINMAVDVDTIVKTILTGNETYFPGFGQAVFGYPRDLLAKRIPFDPKQARALLAEAGFPNGFSFDFYASTGRYPTTDATMPAVVNYLDQIGLKVTLKTMPYAQFLSELLKQTGFGMWQSASIVAGEGHNGFATFLSSKGQYALSVYPDLGIDALFEKQAAEFDPDRR